MKNLEQRTTLLLQVNPNDTISLEPGHSKSPLSAPPIASAKEPVTLPMWNHEDFAQLWQQICQQLTVDDDYLVLKQLVSTFKQAFRVSGCLVLLPNFLIAAWGEESPTLLQPIPNRLDDPLLTGSNSTEILVKPRAQTSQHPGDQRASALTQLWYSTIGENEHHKVQTIWAINTQRQGVTTGLVSFIQSNSQEWTESTLAMFRLATQQVAIVIAQIHLQRQLEKQQQYQTVVNQLAMATRNAADLTEVLNQATVGTARALQAERGLLLRLKYWEPLFRNRLQERVPKVRVSVVSEWVNSSTNPITSVDLPLISSDISTTQSAFWLAECALCQEVLTTNRPVWISDSRLSTSELATNVASLFRLDAMPSLLLSPLDNQGTVLGFLAFQHEQPHEWQAEELELVALVSAQVSTAIIQAEALRQVQGLVEKRTAELQHSLAVQAKLYDRTRQQVNQLRRLNQMKDEFLSTISHELRTPLTSMTMAIRMLRQVGLDSDRRARYLDILEQQCAQESSLINDLLTLQELETQQVSVHLEEIDLKQLLRELVSMWQQKWASKGLSLALNLPEGDLKLYSDRDSLNRIILELLTNSGKYSAPHSEVRLNVSYHGHLPAGQFCIQLCNTGTGMTEEELPYIFDKFRRSRRATQDAIQGLGLGLALVKSWVQLLMGSITVENRPLDADTCETCFTLTLPQSGSTG